MQRAEKIALSSAAGDPRDAQTWSGTPCALLQAFEGAGVSVIPVNARLDRAQRAACKIAQRALRFSGPVPRGPLARLIASRKVTAACRSAGISTILHTSTLDLPLSPRSEDLRRFIYCDSTWNLYARFALDLPRYTRSSVAVYERMEAAAFRQARHLFPISNYVRDNLASHYQVDARSITAVGTGRGKIAPFTGAKDYARGHILLVTKDRFAEKGGRLLLDGFSLAAAKNPSLKLVLAGPAAEQCDRPNVTVTGRLPWDELQRLFQNASLYAMPAFNEPWGLVYLEALACKTPLLGLARNSIPELTHQGLYGFMVERPEPTLVADALLCAFSDPRRLERMGLDGQKFCLENFSWARTVALMKKRMFN